MSQIKDTNWLTIQYANNEVVELKLTSKQISSMFKNIMKIEQPFMPKYNEIYWFVYKSDDGTYSVGSAVFDVRRLSFAFVKSNFVFRTQIEAEIYKWYLKELDACVTTDSLADSDTYFIFYDCDKDLLGVSLTLNAVRYTKNTPIFKSDAKAFEFIDRVGKDYVKKFMFGI